MGGMMIFFLLMVFWILRAASRGMKKGTDNGSKKAVVSTSRVRAAAPSTGSAMEERMKKEFPHLYRQAEQEAVPSPAPGSGSLPYTAPEGDDPCHEDAHAMPSGSLDAASMEGVDPCHDDPWAALSGSLSTESMEGTDPCHDDWRPVHADETVSGEPAAAGGLKLSWTGDEIVKGFVYREILKRKVS